MQALLAHLQRKGFAAPKPLGLDDKGREIVSWMPGPLACGRGRKRCWRPAARADVGALLRRYHNAVADFVPPSPAIWRHGAQEVVPGEIVLHGDFAPYNLIWEGDRLAGVIDFELARPGRPIEDAVFSAARVANLRPNGFAAQLGFAAEPDRRARLRAFAQGYDCTTDALLAHAVEGKRGEFERIVGLGKAGVEPWTGFLERGLEAHVLADLAWLKDNAGSLA